MWLVTADVLVSDPLFLRLGHGQVQCPCKSLSSKCYFLTRKGKVPRHKFHPPESWSWVRGGRSQPVAPAGQVPEPLSSCPCGGGQASSPTGPQRGGAGRSRRQWPRQAVLLLLQRDREVQRFTAAAGLGQGQGWPWRGLWSPAGKTPGCSLGPSSPPEPGPGNRLEVPGLLLTTVPTWWPAPRQSPA